MSVEGIPNNQESQEPLSSERAGNLREITAEAGVGETAAPAFNPDNKSFFEKMSEGGKRIADQVYESLCKISGINSIIGKLEIAYNQFWINLHPGAIIQLKERMSGLDSRMGELDRSKRGIELLLEGAKLRSAPPGVVESLHAKLQDIDRQKKDISDAKTAAESALQTINNKTELYIRERDRVADQLIERYAEKLKLIEARIEMLRLDNLQIVVAESKHQSEFADLRRREIEISQLEEYLRETRMSEKEIKKFEAVVLLKRELLRGIERVRAEKAKFARLQAAIDKEIATANARADRYRKKQTTFARVKRGELIQTEADRAERIVAREPAPEAEGEVVEKIEDKKQLRILSLLDAWNTFVEEARLEAANSIDKEVFMEATDLPASYVLDIENFTKILDAYLRYRKLLPEQLSRNIEAFEKKIKA